jgi:hypothetical protein
MAQKYTQWPLNIPNDHKIYQHFLFKALQNLTPIWIFGFENIPSGNPGQSLIQAEKVSRSIQT